MTVWLELAIVVGLILLNGFFAMAELAMASSRRIRLQQMAETGSRGAARALTLTENPGRFLSAVQVGITLIGIMSGAYGGSTLGARLGVVLNEYPIFAPRGDGDCVRSRGHRDHGPVGGRGRTGARSGSPCCNPRRSPRWSRGPVQILVLVARPLVWFLETSTALLLKLLRIPEKRTDIGDRGRGQDRDRRRHRGRRDRRGRGGDDPRRAAARRHVVASIMMPRPDVYWVDLSTTRPR